MKRSNLIPITRIYDIYPKYTYSDDVKKFMDEIVDIDRADVCTKDEVITMLTELKGEMNPIKECEQQIYGKENWNFVRKCQDIIQQKIDTFRMITN